MKSMNIYLYLGIILACQSLSSAEKSPKVEGKYKKKITRSRSCSHLNKPPMNSTPLTAEKRWLLEIAEQRAALMRPK
jgi:hypothetical protein